MRFDLHPLGTRESFGQMNALFELVEHVARGVAGHDDAIRLAHSVTRMREPVGQVAVVGHQDQALAVQVEPADGEQPGVLRVDQIDDSSAARGIAIRA